MRHGLAGGDRIEIRGFGNFSLHFRAARVGRNPKSGDKVELLSKFVPHFKPGNELRERVNLNREKSTHSVASSKAVSAPGLYSADHHSEQSWPA